MGKANKKIKIDDVFDDIDDDNIGRRSIVNIDDDDFEDNQSDHFDENDFDEGDIVDLDEIDSDTNYDDYSESPERSSMLDDDSHSLPADWQDFDYYDEDQDWD